MPAQSEHRVLNYIRLKLPALNRRSAESLHLKRRDVFVTNIPCKVWSPKYFGEASKRYMFTLSSGLHHKFSSHYYHKGLNLFINSVQMNHHKNKKSE